MEFARANPSVIKSIKQRVLLNAWLRALRKPHPLPAISAFQPDGIGDELADMMGFEVEREGETARFLITQEGSRLAATYGNQHVDPAQRTNRYLDEAIGRERYARVWPCYRECIVRKRPTYSVTKVRDSDGKEVSFERLLLPFSDADAVQQIVGSYKAISIEGGFKIDNLLGIRRAANPVRVVNAVIDLELSRRPAGVRICDDIIEAD